MVLKTFWKTCWILEHILSRKRDICFNKHLSKPVDRFGKMLICLKFVWSFLPFLYKDVVSASLRHSGHLHKEWHHLSWYSVLTHQSFKQIYLNLIPKFPFQFLSSWYLENWSLHSFGKWFLLFSLFVFQLYVICVATVSSNSFNVGNTVTVFEKLPLIPELFSGRLGFTVCTNNSQHQETFPMFIKIFQMRKVFKTSYDLKQISTTNHMFGRAIWDKLPESIFENFEIALVLLRQFQNF